MPYALGLLIQGMSANTRCLPRTTQILSMGDCLEMVRVKAEAVAAQMVYLKPFGDLAMSEFVDHTMHVLRAALSVSDRPC
jgi:hypothetical protein